MVKLKPPPQLMHTPSPTESQLTYEGKRFLQLSLSLTSVCRLNCPDCYANANKNKPEQLEESEIKNLMGEAVELSATSIRVTGGDVFLHPYFLDDSSLGKHFPLITEANKGGLGVIALINDVKVDGESCNRLYEKDVSFLVKFWGPPELQGKLTGCEKLFKKKNYSEYEGLLIPDGLKKLIDAGFNEKTPSRIGIQTMLVPENKKFSINAYEWARKNNVIPFMELKMGADPGNYFSVDEIRDLFGELREIDNGYGYDWKAVSHAAGWTSCNRVFYGLVVRPNGDITSCSATPPIGNIRTGDSLASIWNGDKLKKFLSEAEKMGGCRCHAHIRTGNALTPYEFALGDKNVQDKTR